MQQNYDYDIKPEEDNITQFIEVPESQSIFSRSHHNNQVIEVTLTSPFKDIMNSN